MAQTPRTAARQRTASGPAEKGTATPNRTIDPPAADAGWFAGPQPPSWTRSEPRPLEALQLRRLSVGAQDKPGTMQQIASRGMADSPRSLPHANAVQRAFGPHDVSGIQAHVGPAATAANQALGAAGFATGEHVAFAGDPDLHTAAHEAAHVVQQREGVHLKDNTGQAGDLYERHADEVADRVVSGRSAADLLGGGAAQAPDAAPGSRAGAAEDLQLKRLEAYQAKNKQHVIAWLNDDAEGAFTESPADVAEDIATWNANHPADKLTRAEYDGTEAGKDSWLAANELLIAFPAPVVAAAPAAAAPAVAAAPAPAAGSVAWLQDQVANHGATIELGATYDTSWDGKARGYSRRYIIRTAAGVATPYVIHSHWRCTQKNAFVGHLSIKAAADEKGAAVSQLWRQHASGLNMPLDSSPEAPQVPETWDAPPVDLFKHK